MRLFMVGLFFTLTIMQASFAQTLNKADAARVINELEAKYPHCWVRMPIIMSEPIVHDAPYKLVEEYWDFQTEEVIMRWVVPQKVDREDFDIWWRGAKVVTLTESYLVKNRCTLDGVEFNTCMTNVVYAATAAFCNYVSRFGLPAFD